MVNKIFRKFSQVFTNILPYFKSSVTKQKISDVFVEDVSDALTRLVKSTGSTVIQQILPVLAENLREGDITKRSVTWNKKKKKKISFF